MNLNFLILAFGLIDTQSAVATPKAFVSILQKWEATDCNGSFRYNARMTEVLSQACKRAGSKNPIIIEMNRGLRFRCEKTQDRVFRYRVTLEGPNVKKDVPEYFLNDSGEITGIVGRGLATSLDCDRIAAAAAVYPQADLCSLAQKVLVPADEKKNPFYAMDTVYNCIRYFDDARLTSLRKPFECSIRLIEDDAAMARPQKTGHAVR